MVERAGPVAATLMTRRDRHLSDRSGCVDSLHGADSLQPEIGELQYVVLPVVRQMTVAGAAEAE